MSPLTQGLNYRSACDEFILGTVGSACMGSENHCETIKSLQICYLFNSESVVSKSQTSTN